MTSRLNVFSLPMLVEPKDVAGGTVVIIDVLRASTTIVHALEAGAMEVIPCLEVEDAQAIAQQFPNGDAILGGERHGLPIDGFDLGNSPEDYVPEVVADKAVIFTTTNGTRAIGAASKAKRVLIGAFVNAQAVVRDLLQSPQDDIHLICAGTDGAISNDDVLLAGMLVERITRLAGVPYEQNAQALTARETWLHRFALPQAIGAEPLPPERLAAELRKSPGGRNLVNIGRDDDILTAARIDRFEAVPEMDPEKTRIRLV